MAVLLHFVRVQAFVNPTRKAQTTIILFSTPENDGGLQKTFEKTLDYEGRLPRRGNDFRCGFCSIIGAANMGKSTLLNALLEQNLCSVTRRPQTTRHAILGVLTTESTQLCLVDTPGIIGEPAYKLQEGMMEAVVGAFKNADILLVVTDIFSTPIPNDDLFERIQTSRKPVIVVINKIDLAARANKEANEEEGRTVTVPQAVAKWRSLLPNALAILPISASEGNVDVLRKILLGESDIPGALRDLGRPVPGMFRVDAKTVSQEEARALLPVGPPLYDEETLTDRSERYVSLAKLILFLRRCLTYHI
jgi:GTP-binding protein Era